MDDPGQPAGRAGAPGVRARSKPSGRPTGSASSNVYIPAVNRLGKDHDVSTDTSSDGNGADALVGYYFNEIGPQNMEIVKVPASRERTACAGEDDDSRVAISGQQAPHLGQ